ncbi:MAG: YraN family protein [Candidatus Babeliales bacterium]
MALTQDLGSHGEEKVALWLTKQGFTIQAMNYRQRCGEIDIIACKNEVLAFVEVKLRTHAYFNISEVITPSKQAKIIRTAMMYIMEHKISNKVYRFDVALLEKHTDKYKLTYLPNAFTQSAY